MSRSKLNIDFTKSKESFHKKMVEQHFISPWYHYVAKTGRFGSRSSFAEQPLFEKNVQCDCSSRNRQMIFANLAMEGCRMARTQSPVALDTYKNYRAYCHYIGEKILSLNGAQIERLKNLTVAAPDHNLSAKWIYKYITDPDVRIHPPIEATGGSSINFVFNKVITYSNRPENPPPKSPPRRTSRGRD